MDMEDWNWRYLEEIKNREKKEIEDKLYEELEELEQKENVIVKEEVEAPPKKEKK